MRHLSYGRIILNSSKPLVSFSDGNRETGLLCLSGNATVKAAGKEFEIGKFDAIYVPRDSSIEISTRNSVDLAEFSSDVTGRYPLKVVRYADVQKEKRRSRPACCGLHLLRPRELDELAAA
jgi:5-deoxy-glucuronate isomerase